MDKRAVTVLSTIHTGEMSSFKKSVRTSGNHSETNNIIDQYNDFMGGVDKSDQLVTYYGFYHHSKSGGSESSFTLLMSLSSMLILSTAR